MPPVLTLPAVGALLLLTACSSSSFSTELRGETVVAGDPAPLSETLNSFPAIGSFTNLDFDQDQEFKNQGVTKGQVSSASVDSLRLRILSPEGQDFGFLDEVRFFAQAGDEEVLIAQELDIDGRATELRLDVEDAELAAYMRAPAMSILMRGRGRVPPQDVRLQAVVTLDVKVDGL